MQDGLPYGRLAGSVRLLGQCLGIVVTWLARPSVVTSCRVLLAPTSLALRLTGFWRRSLLSFGDVCEASSRYPLLLMAGLLSGGPVFLYFVHRACTGPLFPGIIQDKKKCGLPCAEAVYRIGISSSFVVASSGSLNVRGSKNMHRTPHSMSQFLYNSHAVVRR